MVSRLVFLSLFIAGCSDVFSQDVNNLGPPGSSLVFGDEFNTATLNTDMWGFGINDKNVQNTGVDCAYSKEISISRSLLVFTQRRKPSYCWKHGPLKHLITSGGSRTAVCSEK